MIQLSRIDYDRIVAHARSVLPEEACGLIAGVEQGGVRVVKRVYLLENTDHSNEHFTISPKDHLTALKDMRAAGLDALGNWHSHPETPSRPSEEDKRLAFDPGASYMILSLADRDRPVLKSFRIEKGESREEALLIEP
ncbi:M67 family metallopeptidase [Sutterella sp.]|uniref:M67 family metallopeptidase n=1 Tax=Sutterella sp. TaxID=1981025 RepID=UPI0026DF5D23|nr:M67 family metallopeptidase [Sutterella sp.]MDO5532965.1 M67 family metallopeptidase [Sutterella sp.]